MAHEDSHSTHFNSGLLLGAMIGGVAALLLSPRSGKKNREVLNNKLGDAKKTWEESDGDVKETLNTLFGGVIDKGSAQYQKARAMLDERLAEGKQTLAELRQKDFDEIVEDISGKFKQMRPDDGQSDHNPDTEYWREQLRRDYDDAASTLNNSQAPAKSRGRNRTQ